MAAGPSLELQNWINDHKSEVHSAVGDFHGYDVITAWMRIIDLLEQYGAPVSLQDEARTLRDALASPMLDKHDHDALRLLAVKLKSERSQAAISAAIHEAVASGSLSSAVGDRLNERLGSSGGIHPEFSLGACGFCGLLGSFSGPVGSAVACVICGAAA